MRQTPFVSRPPDRPARKNLKRRIEKIEAGLGRLARHQGRLAAGVNRGREKTARVICATCITPSAHILVTSQSYQTRLVEGNTCWSSPAGIGRFVNRLP